MQIVTAGHPFMRMPEIQQSPNWLNRYEIEADFDGTTYQVEIGSCTDFPTRHDQSIASTIKDRVQAFYAQKWTNRNEKQNDRAAEYSHAR